MNILCSIATRGRYDTTLPLAIMAVINQTRRPDKLIIFDDNDEPKDMRQVPHYAYMFTMMDTLGLKWEWVFAQRRGQHHIHQLANYTGFDFVWRVDDDCVPTSSVLQELASYIAEDDEAESFGPLVGAVGGAILTPPLLSPQDCAGVTGKIENISLEPNLQWGFIPDVKEVDHLHCSFLYRAGVHDYDLGLSRVAHREETLFTYGLKRKGYRILAVPNANSWHMKSSTGGIRSEDSKALFDHDEARFQQFLRLTPQDSTPVVMDNGMGDHVILKSILHEIKKPLVFSCYPDILPGFSIGAALNTYGDLLGFNIYAKMDQWNWKGSLRQALRKLYVDPTIKDTDVDPAPHKARAPKTTPTPLVVIAPSAKVQPDGRRNPKDWDKWASLVGALRVTAPEARIIQVGVTGDTQYVEDVRFNLPLSELEALIDSCTTWVSLDSFFQHLAWSRGVPGTVVFTQSDPRIFGHKENVNVLRDPKYLRAKQFWLWTQSYYMAEASPDIGQVLNGVLLRL